MVAVTWEQVSPAFYIVLGSALSFAGTYAVEVRRQASADAQRAKDVGRERLTMLQDTIEELSTVVISVAFQYERDRSNGRWDGEEVPRMGSTSTAEENFQIRTLSGKVAVLRSRCPDESVRDLAGDYTDEIQRMADARGTTVAIKLRNAAKIIAALDERIGELLRTTYA